MGPLRIRVVRRFAAAGAAALISGWAFAQEGNELVAFINAYRSASQTCDGKLSPATGPLAPDAALAGVRISSAGQLQDTLQAHGYQAAQAQVITLSGPAGASEAMAAIRQRFCRTLLSADYADIGVAREGDAWQIVLARPLLSAALGDWREAGREALELVNTARAEPRTCGDRRFEPAPPLAWNPALAAASIAHSEEMAKRNAFGHRAADGSDVGDRATREGYEWRRVGENIAAGQGSAGQVVSAWLSSPLHCANIMNGGFTEMGVAYAVNPASEGTIYWTQVFGTPR